MLPCVDLPKKLKTPSCFFIPQVHIRNKSYSAPFGSWKMVVEEPAGTMLGGYQRQQMYLLMLSTEIPHKRRTCLTKYSRTQKLGTLKSLPSESGMLAEVPVQGFRFG